MGVGGGQFRPSPTARMFHEVSEPRSLQLALLTSGLVTLPHGAALCHSRGLWTPEPLPAPASTHLAAWPWRSRRPLPCS